MSKETKRQKERIEWHDVKERLPWLINHTFEESRSDKLLVFDGNECKEAYFASNHFSGKEGFYHEGHELTEVIRWMWLSDDADKPDS